MAWAVSARRWARAAVASRRPISAITRAPGIAAPRSPPLGLASSPARNEPRARAHKTAGQPLAARRDSSVEGPTFFRSEATLFVARAYCSRSGAGSQRKAHRPAPRTSRPASTCTPALWVAPRGLCFAVVRAPRPRRRAPRSLASVSSAARAYAASNPRSVCSQVGARARARGCGDERRPSWSRIG